MRVNHEFVKYAAGGRQIGVFFHQNFGYSSLILAYWLGGLYLDFRRK